MPKCSVLIIEDEKNIQTFMGKVLKRQDYRVLYADNGQQGLEIIRSQCPDIILLDLGLPDMNGSEIIRDAQMCIRDRSGTGRYIRGKRDRYTGDLFG